MFHIPIIDDVRIKMSAES